MCSWIWYPFDTNTRPPDFYYDSSHLDHGHRVSFIQTLLFLYKYYWNKQYSVFMIINNFCVQWHNWFYLNTGCFMRKSGMHMLYRKSWCLYWYCAVCPNVVAALPREWISSKRWSYAPARIEALMQFVCWYYFCQFLYSKDDIRKILVLVIKHLIVCVFGFNMQWIEIYHCKWMKKRELSRLDRCSLKINHSLSTVLVYWEWNYSHSIC